MSGYISRAIVWLVIIALTSIQFVNAQTNCVSPNSKHGVCISIHNCPVLFNILRKGNVSDDGRKFLNESACTGGEGRFPHVCCTEDSGFESKPSGNGEETEMLELSIGAKDNALLPSPPICGLNGTAKKIRNFVGLDEFTWMALLEYGEGNEARCAGSLINQRYVLTAGHCLTGKIIELFGNLNRVRLGEYDTSLDRDCMAGLCSDPALFVEPEELIPHENFSSKYNDIGLVRLNQDVPYTRYINPVCLPSTIGAARSPAGKELVVVGWGRTLQSRRSNIKQRLYVPVADQEQCATKYAKFSNVTDGQLCAGGRYGEDSCDGDNGGPLMTIHNKYWVIEGIVSYGRSCGLEDWPGVYTRVSAYEDWIKSKLKP